MKMVVVGVLVGFLFALAMSVMPCSAAEYPNVASLKPFSEEANFMSLAGYLRLLVFRDQSVWISRPEAERAVKQQLAQR